MPVIDLMLGGFTIFAWVAAGIAALLGVIGVILGGFFTFLVVKKTLAHSSSALDGKSKMSREEYARSLPGVSEEEYEKSWMDEDISDEDLARSRARSERFK